MHPKNEALIRTVGFFINIA